MVRLASSKVLAWFLALTAAYWLATAVFPITSIIDALNGAFLAVGILITVIFAPLFWRSVVKRDLDRVGIFAIGVSGLWAAYVGARALSAYFREFGDIADAVNNPLFGYFVLLATAAGVLQIVAPGIPADGIKGKFGGRYRWWIVAALAVGIGAALAL